MDQYSIGLPPGDETSHQNHFSDVEQLKQEIIERFNAFKDAISTNNKEYIRHLHNYSKHRSDAQALQEAWLEYNRLKHYFISPKKIDVSNIRPILLNVDDSPLYKRLFKLVRHTWSMPYSKGYGRRLRFLVWDEYHNSVIGIIGMQSPPADLRSRDQLFEYPKDKKLELVNQTLDVYTLGAAPPYTKILGGKLVAGLVATEEIQEAFQNKYSGKFSEMDRKLIDYPLVGVTTTSAFGRSSIYNRLVIKDRLLAKPIGYTQGFGTIHLEPIFPQIIEFLKSKNLYHNGGYGKGPKPKWQNAVRAMQNLGISQNYLKHGLGRQVFLFEFYDDLVSGMKGESFGNQFQLSVQEYSEYWLERWAQPRAKRTPEWIDFDIDLYFYNSLKLKSNNFLYPYSVEL